MATKPKAVVMQATAAQILNAIRNGASTNYRESVPVAEETLDSLHEIGAIIMQAPGLQNEFLSSLVNRIGRVIITSKMYSNPWEMFKKGTLDFGETVEEVFVELARPFEFDPAVSETEIFKREIPDVRSAFHIMNYQKFYKTTVSQAQLRQAFMTMDGINDLVTKIINSMYAGANYDEFLVMKYMLGVHILAGELTPLAVPEITEANMNRTVSIIKGTSNAFEFMSSKYNLEEVHTYSLKDDQYIIVNSNFDAVMDVEVLASAFNMNKADFMGHRVLVDSFGSMDTDRLDQLLGEQPGYHKFTAEELKALDAIPAVLVDRNFFMILDNLYEFTEQYNGQGLYWNYWYHVWKTMSISPFANSAVFVPDAEVGGENEISVESITVSPAAVTVSPGQTVQFTATVKTKGFAPSTVEWSIDAPKNDAEISRGGLLTVKTKNTASITVTATSTYDSGKTNTATVTVSQD